MTQNLWGIWCFRVRVSMKKLKGVVFVVFPKSKSRNRNKYDVQFLSSIWNIGGRLRSESADYVKKGLSFLIYFQLDLVFKEVDF